MNFSIGANTAIFSGDGLCAVVVRMAEHHEHVSEVWIELELIR